jgi:sulfatase modifying factor 1
MFVRLILILGMLGWASAQPRASSPGKRWALVIFNSNYKPLPPLPSAAGDAKLMGDVLEKAGFEVHPVKNVTLSDFFAKEEEFLKGAQAGDVCFVYYSGYAVQGALEDDNYLLPVDFEPQSAKPLEDRAYHLERMRAELEKRGAALKMFVLEGSRSINTPITGAGRGLMEPHISDSTETLFWFSASPGQTVAQADIAPARFTQAVAKYINEPGLRLSEIFDNVKRQVVPAAQLPYAIDNVTQNFYFHEPLKPPPPPPPIIIEKTVFPKTNSKDRLEYVWIPAGKFKMGCVPNDLKCQPNAKPQHPVTISHGFWMGRTEVEVGAYRRYVDEQAMKEGKKKGKMPEGPGWDRHWNVTNNPIVNVTWAEAKNYCTWTGGRLPTEAEWEYAARGGASDEIYPLNDENSRDKANFSGVKENDRFPEVAPVKSFDPNVYGLYDMAGNVWEWVNDFYSAHYYSESAEADPKGPVSGKEHVARGGSWDSDPKEHLRISYRQNFGKSGNTLGFRCVLDDTPETNKIWRPETGHGSDLKR